jgi:hypothetical protein
MRRIAPALIAAALLAGCGGEEATTPRSAGLANLTIRVDEDGAKGAPARELQLTCDKPADSAACKTAAELTRADLAPTPGDQACTQIFGGPETATITGTLRGDSVDARFSRSDGCEIQRWKQVEPLLAEVR